MNSESFDIDPAANAMWIANGMESKRYEYQIQPYETVLDIGAYQGEWSVLMNQKYGCQSIMFEPVDILREFMTYDWCEVVCAAAWTHDGVLSFGGNGYWTSHYIKGDQEYRCVDILNYIQHQIAVCKINIEGGEYSLLAHILESGMQTNICNFQVQFHRVDYYEKHYKLISSKLSETHRLTWRIPYVWENWQII